VAQQSSEGGVIVNHPDQMTGTAVTIAATTEAGASTREAEQEKDHEGDQATEADLLPH